MTAARKIVPTEHIEQRRVVEWFHYQHRALAGCEQGCPGAG